MSANTKTLVTLLIASTLLAGNAVRAQAEPTGAEDLRVYVNEVTGDAFVKTPSGWKFIRRIESREQIETAIRLNRDYGPDQQDLAALEELLRMRLARAAH